METDGKLARCERGWGSVQYAYTVLAVLLLDVEGI